MAIKVDFETGLELEENLNRAIAALTAIILDGKAAREEVELQGYSSEKKEKDIKQLYTLTIIKKELPEIKRNISNFNTDHLEWIYNRMLNVFNIDKGTDYMLKFKEIIEQLKTNQS